MVRGRTHSIVQAFTDSSCHLYSHNPQQEHQPSAHPRNLVDSSLRQGLRRQQRRLITEVTRKTSIALKLSVVVAKGVVEVANAADRA